MLMARERIRVELLRRKIYHRVKKKDEKKRAFSMRAEENPQVGRGPVMSTTELRAQQVARYLRVLIDSLTEGAELKRSSRALWNT